MATAHLYFESCCPDQFDHFILSFNLISLSSWRTIPSQKVDFIIPWLRSRVQLPISHQFDTPYWCTLSSLRKWLSPHSASGAWSRKWPTTIASHHLNNSEPQSPTPSGLRDTYKVHESLQRHFHQVHSDWRVDKFAVYHSTKSIIFSNKYYLNI